MIILSIESSCDETSVAVCQGREVLSNIVATQIEEHKKYGGVVPEIASRRHTEAISAVCDEALAQAGITYKDIDAVAVTFFAFTLAYGNVGDVSLVQNRGNSHIPYSFFALFCNKESGVIFHCVLDCGLAPGGAETFLL